MAVAIAWRMAAGSKPRRGAVWEWRLSPPRPSTSATAIAPCGPLPARARASTPSSSARRAGRGRDAQPTGRNDGSRSRRRLRAGNRRLGRTRFSRKGRQGRPGRGSPAHRCGPVQRRPAPRRRPPRGSRSSTPLLEDLDLDGALLGLDHRYDVAALRRGRRASSAIRPACPFPCRRPARACGTQLTAIACSHQLARGGARSSSTCGSAAPPGAWDKGSAPRRCTRARPARRGRRRPASGCAR